MLSSLSVIVPAYNEESRLPATLSNVVAYLQRTPDRPAEILVIDDGSTDGTFRVAQQQANDIGDERLSMTVLSNPGNRGKGYSVRHGVEKARWEWILFTDADLSAPIEECDKLVAAVSAGRGVSAGGGSAGPYDIAIGSRALDRSLIGIHQNAFRETMGRMFNHVVRLVAGLPYRDTQCGFKLFTSKAARAIFQRQRLDRFGFDVEILFLARKLGFEAIEVPVRWNHTEGTKVSMLSGADAFVDIARVRWNDWTGKYR